MLADVKLQQVDFYVLPEVTTEPFICRLLEKAYQAGNRVFVLVRDEVSAKKLDDALWTFHDISFVPHGIKTAMASQAEPITISYEFPLEEDTHYYDVLFLGVPRLPDHYAAFSRLMVMVPQEADQKEAARTIYKKLQQEGYALNTHQNKVS